MDNQRVRTRGARRHEAQEESSIARVLTPNLGVNENDPTIDNVSKELEGFVDEEVNHDPIDGAISKALLRVLHELLEASLVLEAVSL